MGGYIYCIRCRWDMVLDLERRVRKSTTTLFVDRTIVVLYVTGVFIIFITNIWSGVYHYTS